MSVVEQLQSTAANVEALFGFYRLTGDRKYIARLPEALDWLDQVIRLPDGVSSLPREAMHERA